MANASSKSVHNYCVVAPAVTQKENAHFDAVTARLYPIWAGLSLLFAAWLILSPASAHQDAARSGVVVATQLMSQDEASDVQSYGGAIDVTLTIQRIIDTNPGRTILLPAGRYNFTSHITIPAGVCLVGEGWAELPFEPAKHGTIIFQNYTAAQDRFGFYVNGTGACLRNLEIRQPQPAPHAGWHPTEGPWAIYAYADRYKEAGGHRLSVDHVMLRNVFDGIRLQDVRGGYLHDIYGQPMHWGIYISGNGDEPHLSDIHLGWTYWTGDKNVVAWRKANATAFLFGRVDNPQGVNLFAFGQKTGFRFFYDRSHDDANYDGVTSAGSFVNIDSDDCVICIAIEDNPEVSFLNFFVTPDIGAEKSTCLASYGVSNPGADYGNLRLTISSGKCQGATGPAFEFAYAPPGKPLYPQYVRLFGIHIERTGSKSVPLPAIFAVRGVSVYAPDLTVDDVTAPNAILQGGGTLAPSRTSLEPHITSSNLQSLGDLDSLSVKGERIDTSWFPYKPTLSCWNGSVAAAAGSKGFYKKIGKTVAVTIKVTIAADYRGSCRFLEVTPPFAPDMTTKQLLPAREDRSGILWSGAMNADGKIRVSRYDGSGVVPPNAEFLIQGVYWSQ